MKENTLCKLRQVLYACRAVVGTIIHLRYEIGYVEGSSWQKCGNWVTTITTYLVCTL